MSVEIRLLTWTVRAMLGCAAMLGILTALAWASGGDDPGYPRRLVRGAFALAALAGAAWFAWWLGGCILGCIRPLTEGCKS